MRRLGLHAHQSTDAACCAVLGFFFQQAACQHESNDHDGGIEEGMPANASTPPYGITKEGVEGTQQESYQRTQCHQRVHIGSPMEQLSPG